MSLKKYKSKNTEWIKTLKLQKDLKLELGLEILRIAKVENV